MPKRIALTLTLLAALLTLGCDQEDIDQLSAAVGAPLTQLEPTNGRNITTDQTITGEHITGQVTINADVTITDSVIETSSMYGIKVESGSLTLEGVDIVGHSDDTCAAGIYGANWSATNVEITGCEDGAKPQGNVLMQSVFIHTLDVSGVDPHADAIQIRSGNHITITDSVLIAPWRASNAVLQINPAAGPITNTIIEGNVMSGGNFIVNGGGNPDVALRDNTLEVGSTTNPKTGDNQNCGFIVNVTLDHSGNVWSDGSPAD